MFRGLKSAGVVSSSTTARFMIMPCATATATATATYCYFTLILSSDIIAAKLFLPWDEAG